ncbi:MAG TPA: hypothetical protein VJW93_15255 [Candidatus Acidoferrales bacterium]|nr:hypothetical protein [Candidatus Acidoferrales bacterium]
MENKEWTLLVLAAADGRPISPVQLQKSLFLLSKNLTPAQLQRRSLYEFQPYDYGPFDSAVYSDAESLSAAGLIAIESGGPARTYLPTTRGLEEARTIREGLDSVAAQYLEDVVNWVLRQSFGNLVRAIYKSYPDMRKNSVFRD